MVGDGVEEEEKNGRLVGASVCALDEKLGTAYSSSSPSRPDLGRRAFAQFFVALHVTTLHRHSSLFTPIIPPPNVVEWKVVTTLRDGGARGCTKRPVASFWLVVRVGGTYLEHARDGATNALVREQQSRRGRDPARHQHSGSRLVHSIGHLANLARRRRFGFTRRRVKIKVSLDLRHALLTGKNAG